MDSIQSTSHKGCPEVQASECCLFSDGAAQTDPVAEAQPRLFQQ